MKSPWKFLSNLTARRRPAGTAERLIGHDSQSKPMENEAQPTLAPPLAMPEEMNVRGDEESLAADLLISTADPKAEVATPAPALPTMEADRDPLDALGEGQSSDAGEHRPLAKSKPIVESPSLQRAKPPEGRKPHRLDAIATTNDEPLQPAPSASPVIDEATNLDEEIKQLRRQLAYKLQSQNNQLREMLARFDRS